MKCVLPKKLLVLVCLAAAVVLALTPALRAQSASFEVTSVKPSNPNPTGPAGANPMVLPALGRLTAMNVTLRILIVAAYQKQPFQIVGGTPWWNDDKFDITAVAEDKAATTDRILEMLKGLLADRFKMKTHVETREVPIYNLVLARGDGRLGAKMKPSTDVCPDFKVQQQQQLEAIAKGGVQALAALQPKPGETRPCSIASGPGSTPGSVNIKATGQSMTLLTLLLTQFVGRPVVDKTGLTGPHDFEFVVDIQTLLRIYQELGINVPLPPNLPEGPSLMTQLQEELGLKLDAQRGPGEVLVVDSAERPLPD
jgi:uncharacterized protein (TIGR03435 family)